MKECIAGIQQIGIGVKDAIPSLHYYARLFGMNTLVFNDVSEARLMTRYTGGNVYNRQALLSMNLKGGGGFEIWQFKNRQPSEPIHTPQYGDLGIYAAKIKCASITATHAAFQQMANTEVSALLTDAKGDAHFWMRDSLSNVFNVISGDQWFQPGKTNTGGVTGAVIGVSDMEAAIKFYQSLLSINAVAYDVVTTEAVNGVHGRFRKVLLLKPANGKGAFGKLLGSIELELVQCLDRQPEKIYANRYWGDCGFIHLCFDVFDMCSLKKMAEEKGYTFTVDSQDSFEMEAAAGRFCYIEDPDGTLIELVETHKVPIYKKLGLYLNLKKRNLEKPLPDWMIKLLALSKVK